MNGFLRWTGLTVVVLLLGAAAVMWAAERPRGGENGELAAYVDCTWWKGEQVAVSGTGLGGDHDDLLITTDPGAVREILTNQRELRSRWRGDAFNASFEEASTGDLIGLFAEDDLVRMAARAELSYGTWRVTSFAECYSDFES